LAGLMSFIWEMNYSTYLYGLGLALFRIYLSHGFIYIQGEIF
jgi:hypothetical protein